MAAATMLLDGTSRLICALPPARRTDLARLAGHLLLLAWSRRLPVVARNFAIALADPPASSRSRALARASVLNYAQMAVDFLVVQTMDDAAVLRWVAPLGREHLEAALRDRRGVIMALPHLGSWDVAAAFAAAIGCRLTVVTEGDWAARLVASSRRGRGVSLAPRDGSLRPVFRALARNECVAILCDAAPEGVPAMQVPFFGRPAPFPVGPARLALRTGAPILVTAAARLPDGSYRIEAQPPIRPGPTPSPEAVQQALTEAIARGFERFIAAYPEQWYPFHPVWPGERAAASPRATTRRGADGRGGKGRAAYLADLRRSGCPDRRL